MLPSSTSIGQHQGLNLFALLVLLLMCSAPASAKTTRIDFYQVGGDECMPVLEPPHISGPNMHLQGTYTCPTVAYDMDGIPFPMATGLIVWYDAQAQVVDGHTVLSAKLRLETTEGGLWVGSLVEHADGSLKSRLQGEGMYEGLHLFGSYDPAIGWNGGDVLINE